MSAVVYIVTVHDRHSDDSHYIYASKGNALARARKKADEAAEHYHCTPDEDLHGEIFRSYIEDASEITVTEAAIEDVEDAGNPYLLHGDELKRAEDERRKA